MLPLFLLVLAHHGLDEGPGDLVIPLAEGGGSLGYQGEVPGGGGGGGLAVLRGELPIDLFFLFIIY